MAHFALPNVQDEPRPWLARAVLLGARIVTAMVVGSGALLGFLYRAILLSHIPPSLVICLSILDVLFAGPGDEVGDETDYVAARRVILALRFVLLPFVVPVGAHFVFPFLVCVTRAYDD